MDNDEFIYDLCIKSLNNPVNLTNDQKKQYMQYLFTDFAQKKNELALENHKGTDIYLKITYKYAKFLKSKENSDKYYTLLQWIINNKNAFLRENVKDLYLIGSAQCLLNDAFVIGNEQDIENNCCNDYQIFKYYQNYHKDKLNDFIQKIATEVRSGEKTIKHIEFLKDLFDASEENKEIAVYENVLLFFRLYFSRLLSKKDLAKDKQQKQIKKLLHKIENSLAELLNPSADINSDLHTEICNFFIFYDSNIYNYICESQIDSNLSRFYDIIDKLISKIIYLPEHKKPEINTYIKFKFGLNIYQDNRMQSEIYFRAASTQNYLKAMYFLSEVVKHSNQKEALDLYDKIIKYEIGKNEKESKNLNERSDRLEKACALYQKGLVYAEGLYSKNIDWEIVDQCWGNPESDLCITKIDILMRFGYIGTKFLNLQFIKYKADHGLLEAKHMYFTTCTKNNLTSENDLLVIYMHELCLFANYDEKCKYLEEMEEYARRLNVGEGVEKDKKKAKIINDEIRKIKNK